MSRSVRVFQVDAFTDHPFAGNPAGVVLDADALSATEMQAIARELNNGDTAFLLAPDGSDHELRVRFFTPRTEAGFVGHATVAAHAVLRALGRPPASRQKQGTGIVHVQSEEGDGGHISIAQSPAPLRTVQDAGLLAEALAALQLHSAELDPRCPPAIAGSGSTRLLLALNEGARLATLQPDLSRLTELSARIGAAGYFLYSLRSTVADCDTEARMFCPALGIPEDPVSGNAHGMLGAHLLACGQLRAQQQRVAFLGAQGHHVGRPGRVRVTLELAATQLRTVTIAGQAAIVFETSIRLP
jgi:PhzF family phenazine biosynthesis protein